MHGHFSDSPYSSVTIISLVLVGMLVTGALVSACDSNGSGGRDLTGTYALVSMEVDGESVSIPEQVSEGQLTLEADGTWDGFFNVDESARGDEIPSTVRGEGEYTVTEGTVRFFLNDVNYPAETEDIAQITGEMNGDRLSVELQRISEESHRATLEKN
ncbi:hypothetical protein [Salinibacter ruber]|uniref:hypothetical protein n=1 Tax=Salinibacter ruber TaxID=146919 RepID=UPI002167FE76|nr:hypothetical protein [Salinibacter ruber]MCS4040362.1 hypothetical protein [Salinibacter ruber]MCS4133556.1 hypothetical protein [Salinibacter ruber]